MFIIIVVGFVYGKLPLSELTKFNKKWFSQVHCPSQHDSVQRRHGLHVWILFWANPIDPAVT